MAFDLWLLFFPDSFFPDSFFQWGKRMMNHQIWMMVVPKILIIGTKPMSHCHQHRFFAAVLLALLVLLCSTAQAEVSVGWSSIEARFRIGQRQTVDAV